MATDMTRLGSDLAELNEGFLETVLQGVHAGLPAGVLEKLEAMSGEARQRLAAVPFALFGFGFEDEAAWVRLLSPGVRDLVPGYVCADPVAERFTLLALAALRGFVRVAPKSTAAWIGLPAETRSRLAAVEIGALGAVATLAAVRLRGRLAQREILWLQLIEAAQGNDERHLGLLAGFGKQWTIRRSLKIEAPHAPARGFRR